MTLGKGLKEFKPVFEISSISPLSISLIYFAPIISRAQVSDDKTNDLPTLPKTKGLIPNGSLMPNILSFVSTTSEYAPLILKRASIIFFIVFFFFDLATNCKIISVSDEL